MISLDSAGVPAQGLGATALPAGAAVGEFVLEALLAQGGFGQVYRAHHATTGRVVAVREGFFVEFRELWSEGRLVALNQQGMALFT